MRTTALWILAVALMVANGCKRDAATPATAPTPTPAAATAPAPAQPAAAPANETVFSREELDQMVAPVALYPDSLLAQVLMAATYPGNVADAVAWSKAHPQAKGDDAVKQVADQPWDPSVQALVAFPQALATLGQDPAWVQRLGDAFLAQPDDVMDAVQRLRHQAQDAGNLASNEYQNVSEQPLPAASAPVGDATMAAPAPAGDSTIIIEPSSPETVYVPSYNPTTVYGSWAYPSYPPVYYPPPPLYYGAGNALVNGMMFGAGIAITNSLWGGMDWNDHDVDIDVNRYNNINVNRRLDVNQNTWNHNPVHRDGVPYRDRNNRELNGRQLNGAGDRMAYRGDDAKRAQARNQARASMERRGVDAPARSNREARDRAQAAGVADRGQARERAQAAGNRGQARDRAQASANRGARTAPQRQTAARERTQAAGARQKPQAARGGTRNAAQNRPQANKKVRQSQSNSAARNSARQQAHGQKAPRNNAFNGASHPSASRSAAQRGHSSHAAAQRPAGNRSAGKQVSRPSHPPKRQGAGHRR